MSQYYEVGDETLWNPSMGVSRVFHGQLGVFEAVIGVPSGVGEMINDEAQVDPAALTAFADALIEWRSHTGHFVLSLLADGFLVTSAALALRAGGTLRWPAPPYDLFDLRAEAEELGARMS